MNHQPFNSWFYDDAPLSAAQAEELRQHMQTCPDCTKQYEAWLAVRHMLRSAEVIRPRPAFSSRWQAGLEARRAREQRRQVRITILALAGAVLLILLGLIIYLSITSSLADLFASVIGTSTQVAVGMVQIGEFFRSLL
ncbi:MAG: zf-HC2 domain-containing protein, partial [Anaerolineaceae bacterium]